MEIQSIEFHTGRGDFERWVQMLGDTRLPAQLAKIREEGLAQEDPRKRTIDVLEARYNELTRAAARQNQQRSKERATLGR